MAKVSTDTKRHLVASDLDRTLSFYDSGRVLSELMGISGFAEKVSGLAKTNLVRQGAELAYLLRHDPEFRSVRKEHLVEADKRVRLLSDSALSVLVPVFEDILSWNSAQIRQVFESYGLAIQEWDKTRTDWVAFQQYIRPLSENLTTASRETA